MYNYLSTVTPDYTAETLDIAPHKSIPGSGLKNQVLHDMDDGTMAVISVSDNSSFTVELKWDYLTTADHATLLDLYHNTSKANGSERTFPWINPVDEKRYTARFIGVLTSETTNYGLITASATLRIEGKYLV